MFLKNRIFQICVFVLTTAIFTGCGAKGEKFSGFEAPKDNNAMLYVYRPSSIVGGGVYYDVKVTTPTDKEHNLEPLKNGGYLKSEIKPNEEVEIWQESIESKTSVTIETKPKQTYCLKGDIGIGFIVGRPHLKQVDMPTCQKEMTETKLSY